VYLNLLGVRTHAPLGLGYWNASNKIPNVYIIAD